MANNAITLKAQDRTEFGKGSARQARRAGQVPAVVYGHGTEPRHLLLEEHATRLALRSNDNALVELDIAGGETLLALAKDVQRHPIRPGVQHVDFLLVDRNLLTCPPEELLSARVLRTYVGGACVFRDPSF